MVNRLEVLKGTEQTVVVVEYDTCNVYRREAFMASWR